ncbi:hypothetical protein B6V73_18315 [Thioclava sp. JM3]|uniref:hypothetical protein n=1 Tax=Thioclava sp. JM3 TaxID=1973004 RepID=UPI000B545833|nr:hypothetical protein [Thioclava sp. JM3]OWY12434.1 hypothetical protein B6V73_18315 [Thioclava sp. JM3]
MGKVYVPHRVVIRDASGKIVSDEEFDDFGAAKPAFDSKEALPGMEVAIQHGARVIFKKFR